MNSKMPKGVEHEVYVTKLHVYLLVMNSKMPKGVEHIYQPDRGITRYHVMNSKMPKGVEHSLYASSLTNPDCDEFEDAERR